MSQQPTNPTIYNKIKEELKHMKPSAYKSGLIVKKYKQVMEEKGLKPYTGRKNHNEGLSRWFRESWVADDGKIGYSHKNSVYRPTVRITAQTPALFSELTKAELERAKRIKVTKGRVDRFKK